MLEFVSYELETPKYDVRNVSSVELRLLPR